MTKELEMAVRGALYLPEEDQAKLVETIRAALEQRGLIQADRLDTIIF